MSIYRPIPPDPRAAQPLKGGSVMKKKWLLFLSSVLLLGICNGCNATQKPPPDIIKTIAKQSVPSAVKIGNSTMATPKVLSVDENITYVLGEMVEKQDKSGVKVKMWPLSVNASGLMELGGFMDFTQKYRFILKHTLYMYKNYRHDGTDYLYEIEEPIKQLYAEKIGDIEQKSEKREEVPLPDWAAPKN